MKEKTAELIITWSIRGILLALLFAISSNSFAILKLIDNQKEQTKIIEKLQNDIKELKYESFINN